MAGRVVSVKKSPKKKTPSKKAALTKTLVENLEKNLEKAEELEEEAFWDSLDSGPSELFEGEPREKLRKKRR